MRLASALMLSSCVWGCAPSPADRPTLRVLAPRALQPVLEPVVVAWEAAHVALVQVGFDSPDRLIRQANGGTRADLFVSADARWMDALEADGHVAPTARRVLAFDPLVFLAPPGKGPVRDPRDLVVRVTGTIGVRDASMPEGALAREALEETQVWQSISARTRTFRTSAQLRASLEAGEIAAAVGLQSTSLLAYDTLSSHPFTPDQSYGSTIEAAVLVGADPELDALRQALLDSLANSPDARSGWSRAGMGTPRGPEPPVAAPPVFSGGSTPPPHPPAGPPLPLGTGSPMPEPATGNAPGPSAPMGDPAAPNRPPPHPSEGASSPR